MIFLLRIFFKMREYFGGKKRRRRKGKNFIFKLKWKIICLINQDFESASKLMS